MGNFHAGGQDRLTYLGRHRAARFKTDHQSILSIGEVNHAV